MATVPLRSLQRSCSWPSEVPPTSTASKRASPVIRVLGRFDPFVFAAAPKRWRSLSLRLLRQIVGPRLCLMPSPHLPRTAGDGRRQSGTYTKSRRLLGYLLSCSIQHLTAAAVATVAERHRIYGLPSRHLFSYYPLPPMRRLENANTD
jgi:hypothetical protein